MSIRNDVDFGKTHLPSTAIYIENPQNYMINRGATAAIQNRFLGILCAALWEEISVPLYLVHPMTVKKIFTGSGRADKKQMVKRAKKLIDPTTRYSKLDMETIADSIAISITGIHHQLGRIKAEAV